MSLNSFLHNVEADIQRIFQGSGKVVQTVLLPAAITVGNALKVVVTADQLDLIGHLAGSVGAAAEDEVRAVLPTVINKLQLAQQYLKVTNDPNTILKATVNFVNKQDTGVKTKFWIDFVAQLWQDLVAPHAAVTIPDSIAATQYAYSNPDITKGA